MKPANSLRLLPATLCFAAVLLAGCGHLAAPKSPIAGKWGTVDRSYAIEFLPSGNCALAYRLNARIGGHARNIASAMEASVFLLAGVFVDYLGASALTFTDGSPGPSLDCCL